MTRGNVSITLNCTTLTTQCPYYLLKDHKGLANTVETVGIYSCLPDYGRFLALSWLRCLRPLQPFGQKRTLPPAKKIRGSEKKNEFIYLVYRCNNSSGKTVWTSWLSESVHMFTHYLLSFPA